MSEDLMQMMDEPKHNYKKILLISMAIVLTIVTAGVIYYFFIHNKKTPVVATKQLSLTIRGESGNEQFKLLVDDVEKIGTTTASKDAKTYNVSIPSDSKKILLTYLNDMSGNDIYIDKFTVDDTNMLPLMEDKISGDATRNAQARDGKLLWGGDYIFNIK